MDDKLDIIDLSNKYVYAIDDHHWDLLNEVFVEDATVCLIGKYIKGLKNIKKFIEDLHNDTITQHLTSNHFILIDGNNAKSKCQLQAYHYVNTNHNSKCYLLIGFYKDLLIKTPEGWRIQHRELGRIQSSGHEDVMIKQSHVPEIFRKK